MHKKLFSIILVLAGFMLAVQAGAATLPAVSYQALTLEDCLALARKENPVLAASREKIQELVADYQAARSRFFPRLTLLSYYTRQPADRFVSGGQPPPNLFTKEQYWGITGKQVLFSGLKNYHNTQAAKHGTEAQKQEVQRTADEVAFTVTEAFYRLIEAKENLRVAQEALSQRQEFAKLTDAFYKAGKVTHLDSFRAQSQVSEAEQAVAEAQTAVRLAKQILARSLGVNENVQVDIKGRLPQEFVAAGEVDALWQGALKDNPEIKRLDLQLAQSQALIKAARGGYFPELSLQGASRCPPPGSGEHQWKSYQGGISLWRFPGVSLFRRGVDPGPGGQSLLPEPATAGGQAGPPRQPQGGPDLGLEGPGRCPPRGDHHPSDRGHQ